MCSIFAIFNLQKPSAEMREVALRQSRLMRHRGPDWSGIKTFDDAVLAHERLAIVDVLHGAQPLVSPDGQQALAVNGEIYNHQDLRQSPEQDYRFTTDSDCEVILPLFRAQGPRFLNQLRGMFAFALYDEEQSRYLIARDPVGIMPLYYGHDELGQLYVASEMKALADVCRQFQVFPPGHYLDSSSEQPQRYFDPGWRSQPPLGAESTPPEAIHDALADAVHGHMMSDVPYGVLLSGGLDSSIIAALASRFAARRVEAGDAAPAWWPRLHSFSIGLEGSPDLVAAEVMAEHIGTVHHGFTYTIQDGLDALLDVVWHLETYDVTTIRAATPMYLMARKIRAMGIKMVLSGEGADEIFGGYLYFHKAPDARALFDETLRKLERLHLYDCLRANKAMAACGIEARVPFLDRDFMNLAMGINPEQKRPGPDRMEKHILREAFADLLPESICWRQKEQFSDGVGYGWIDALKAHAEARVSDAELAAASHRYRHNTPASKEAFYYRSLFESLFPQNAAAATVPGGASVACSSPEAMVWDEGFAGMDEPSGRAMTGVHREAY